MVLKIWELAWGEGAFRLLPYFKFTVASTSHLVPPIHPHQQLQQTSLYTNNNWQLQHSTASSHRRQQWWLQMMRTSGVEGNLREGVEDVGASWLPSSLATTHTTTQAVKYGGQWDTTPRQPWVINTRALGHHPRTFRYSYPAFAGEFLQFCQKHAQFRTVYFTVLCL